MNTIEISFFTFQIYITCKENRICSGTRFHYGYILGWSCDSIFWYTVFIDHCS